MSLSTTFYWRQSKDIFEDFDPHLSTEPSVYPGSTSDPNSLFLGYSYFGLTGDPGSNFILGTLPGAVRKYKGLEIAFRRRFANNWQSLVSVQLARRRG